MKSKLVLAAALLAAPALAADTAKPPTPGEIVATAPAGDWIAIPANDLLVMTLAPDAAGKARAIVIQLIPKPYSSAWTANIRTLASARWWDGLAVVRSQDNYVVQWGDPDAEDKAKARALPAGLMATTESDYVYRSRFGPKHGFEIKRTPVLKDLYAPHASFEAGFPIAKGEQWGVSWPVHCYGAVGVGRNLSPDAGTGAELYTVIGHAPRHLDRNIAVVGRVIEGIEHLSTLPRGTEALGFYATPAERTRIVSIRLASELPAAEQPKFEYLSTDSETFARYANARANRQDDFFIVPAGGADVCNIPVPVRRVTADK
jgi:peptidylprolyl isomerase